MRLRVGTSPVALVFVLIVGLVIFTGFAGFFMMAVSPGALSQIFGSDEHFTRFADGIPQPMKIFFIALSTLGMVGVFFGLIHAARYAFFLNGTQLTARRMFSTDVVDLARATRFWFDDKRQHHRHQHGSWETTTTYIVPLLCVQGSRGVVKIPLAHYGRRLPPDQIDALASAIEWGAQQRRPHGRDAWDIAQRLREFGRSIPGQHFNLIAGRRRSTRSN
jgi:hypothetical protein